MKGMSARIVGGLTIGTKVRCDDNSGAKLLRILSKSGYHGRRGRLPKIGIADIFSASVIIGKTEMLKKIVKAVVIRQRKIYRRSTGDRISFDDNAAALINEKNEPIATEIKGIVAKEVAERYPKIATIAKNVA